MASQPKNLTVHVTSEVALRGPFGYGPGMRKRRLLVAGFLGLAALLGVGIVFGIGWFGIGQDDRQSHFYWDKGRCYRVRFALHGALATSRSETYISQCSDVDRKRSPSGMEWLAVADCHFVNCAASSLTASLTKHKQDFTSTIGYGPNQQDACENAKNHLRQILQRDRCTPTDCSCFKVERSNSATN